MKRTQIEIITADNGGLVFFGPCLPTAPKSPARPARTYICPTLKPEEVGATLLAMLTDVNMTKHDVKEDDLDITF